MTDDHGRVGFAIIGLGFGQSRCPMIQRVPEAKLVAVSSRSEVKARTAAEEFGTDWYTDYREVLLRDDVDVVGVYTPSGMHRDICIDVANAGKHLLTTKPLEITLESADAILDACRMAGVKVATEFVARYSENSYALYRAIHDGKFGKMVLGEFEEKLYRPQWYYDLDGGWRGTWKFGGGGTLMNQTIHAVDQMRWLMGEVESVTARTGTFTTEIETEDTAVALVTFLSGALGVLVGTTTFHNDRPPTRYGGGTVQRHEVNGSQGSATLIDGVATMWKVVGGKEVPSALPLPAMNVFQDYARWVKDDCYESPTLAKGDDSRKTLELVMAVYQSARTGKTVSLPLS